MHKLRDADSWPPLGLLLLLSVTVGLGRNSIWLCLCWVWSLLSLLSLVIDEVWESPLNAQGKHLPEVCLCASLIAQQLSFHLCSSLCRPLRSFGAEHLVVPWVLQRIPTATYLVFGTPVTFQMVRDMIKNSKLLHTVPHPPYFIQPLSVLLG